MLWEIIGGDESVKTKSPYEIEQIGTMFQSMIFEFHDREKGNHANLLSMNKNFIITFITLLNTMTNAQTQQSPTVRPPVNQAAVAVTHEQMQEKRQHDFERDLELKKKDFESSMHVPVPAKPTFADTVDVPLGGDMERMVKEMMAQRQVEYDQYKVVNKDAVFTSPKETSIKNEKFVVKSVVPVPQTQSIQTNNNKVNIVLQQLEKLIQPEKIYIKIEEKTDLKQDIVDLNIHSMYAPSQSASQSAPNVSPSQSAPNVSPSQSAPNVSPYKQISWGADIQHTISPRENMHERLNALEEQIASQQARIESCLEGMSRLQTMLETFVVQNKKTI